MPVNLSIKNAPDDVVRRLKRRAKKNRRPLHEEVLAILAKAVRSRDILTPGQVLAEVRRQGEPRQVINERLHPRGR